MLKRIINTTSFIRNRFRLKSCRYFLDITQPEDGFGSEGLDGEGSKGKRLEDEKSEADSVGGEGSPKEKYPAPEIGLVLGSGLGGLVESIEIIDTLDYGDVPDFPHSTVKGHKGRFIYGKLGGRYVIAMEGRIHYYEGYSIEDVVLPIRAMCCLGIETMIVSNASGGLSPLFTVGDIMVIDNHINLIPNPLIGANYDELGVRFPDMNAPYDPALIRLAYAVALAQGITLKQGCYVGSTGPTFETPGEVRYLRTIGADATGMSTTPEVIVARHQGVRVLGFSLITNTLSEHPEADVTVTHEEVIEAGRLAMPKLCRVVEEVVANL